MLHEDVGRRGSGTLVRLSYCRRESWRAEPSFGPRPHGGPSSDLLRWRCIGGAASVTPAPARLLVILVSALALSGVACSPDGMDSSPSTSSSPSSNVSSGPSSTVSPEEATRAAVLASWRGYWSAYDDAASRADPDWPGLSQYMTGAALREVQVYLVGLKAEGLVERGGLELRPAVASVGGGMAVVRDCLTDDGHQYDRAGNLRGRPGPVTRGVEAKLVLVGATWKVSERPVPKDGICPA